MLDIRMDRLREFRFFLERDSRKGSLDRCPIYVGYNGNILIYLSWIYHVCTSQ